MFGCFLGRLRYHRDVQAAADCSGDVAKRDAFFRDSVIARSRGALFKRQAEKICGIEAVHRGPTVAAIADIRRDALLASDVERAGDEALFDLIVNRRRQAQDRRADSTGSQRQQYIFGFAAKASDGFRIVRIFFGCEVAWRERHRGEGDDGRSSPRSAVPSSSMARRSVSIAESTNLAKIPDGLPPNMTPRRVDILACEKA